MTRSNLALIDLFSNIPDFRQARGKRHPLPAILALAAAALLCGYRSYSAIAEWGRNYGQALASSLGFKGGKTPCAATLHTIFCHLDKSAVEEHLGRWAEAVLMGHSDLRMTKRYTHATDSRKRAAVEKLVEYGRSEGNCLKFVTKEKREA
jgi:hypothetical protein